MAPAVLEVKTRLLQVPTHQPIKSKQTLRLQTSLALISNTHSILILLKAQPNSLPAILQMQHHITLLSFERTERFMYGFCDGLFY